jgi:hypothetical protein
MSTSVSNEKVAADGKAADEADKKAADEADKKAAEKRAEPAGKMSFISGTLIIILHTHM